MVLAETALQGEEKGSFKSKECEKQNGACVSTTSAVLFSNSRWVSCSFRFLPPLQDAVPSASGREQVIPEDSTTSFSSELFLLFLIEEGCLFVLQLFDGVGQR